MDPSSLTQRHWHKGHMAQWRQQAFITPDKSIPAKVDISFSYISHSLSCTCVRGHLCSRWGIVAETVIWCRTEGSGGELKAADCSALAFSRRNTHLIVALWAAGLQMSQDTNERLVQHANKTAVASPTANHWLCAYFPFLQLRPALLHCVPMPGNRLFQRSFSDERCHLSSGTDGRLWGKTAAAPGHCLWSVREFSDLDRGRHSMIKCEQSAAQNCQYLELTHWNHDDSNFTTWIFNSNLLVSCSGTLLGLPSLVNVPHGGIVA